MQPIYDIEAIERAVRESDKHGLAAAMERAPDPLARRLVAAQAELAEATILQLKVIFQLLNEGIDPDSIARVIGVSMGNTAWALIRRSSDQPAVINTLMNGLIDPGSLGSHVKGKSPVPFVMGGRA